MARSDRGVVRDDADLVLLYLNDVGRYALLSKDDEVRLGQEIEAAGFAQVALTERGATMSATQRRTLRRTVRRGAKAHDEFVVANLRLVVSIAKRYQSSGGSVVGSDPGREPGVDPCGREVRLAERFQVLDVSDVVGPPSDRS